jgi:hypothetical protein
VETSTPGEILTFYSYKGGTGRSMAVANYACWLVRRFPVPSQRVLLIDWDLEAPGLQRYFAEKAGLPENADRPGIINYFAGLHERLESEPELLNSLASDESGQALHEAFPLDGYLIRDVVAGADLIKAGRLDSDYAQLVSTFNWIEFYSKYGILFNVFRRWLELNYVYCLIDSRTGFNDISGVCTMLMPEKLVTVFTPNRQNVYGVLDLAERAVNYRRASGDFRPLSVFPLPSRIDNAELELKKDWREEYQKAFETRLRNIYQLETCDLSDYFDKVQLPHVSYYAYGEEIALLKEKRRDDLSLSGAYEKFFKRLTERETAWDTSEEAEPTADKVPVVMPVTAPAERVEAGIYTGIYISYAHEDDITLMEEQSGWITTFHLALSTRLGQFLGKDVRIWRDETPGGEDYLNSYLITKIHEAAVFIPIVSPRYLNSETCMKELIEFVRAKGHEGLTLGNSSRIFKVIKTIVEREKQPLELRQLLGYEFYEMEPDRGRAREFAHNLGPGSDSKFWNKIDDLAWDIKQVIEKQEAVPPEASSSVPFEKPGVYLADVTSDLAAERDNIKRELQHYGYKVLPDRELPLEGAALEVAVREHLARCALSIHLVGSRYGLIPEGPGRRSVVQIQEELAAERATVDPAFSRLIWMPPGISPAEEIQQKFIQSLQNNIGAGAELLQRTLEEFKTRILEKLSRIQPTKLMSQSGDDLTRVYVYLIYDSRDMAAVAPIEEYLFDRGYEIISSLGEGEGAQSAKYHRENLLNCDAVLIYYGNGNQLWLRSRLWDLQKVKGWGRTTPMSATAVYLGLPNNQEKTRFKTREALVLNGQDLDPATALQPFVAQIESSTT